jgi:hypothetical protein
VLLLFSGSLSADISFYEIQQLTNKIYTVDTRRISSTELSKYLEILEKSQNNISSKEYEKAVQYTNAYFIAMEMKLEPPATALPKIFALYENDTINSQNISIADGTYNMTLKDWAYRMAKSRMGTYLMPDFPMYKYRESIIFNWIPENLSSHLMTVHFYYSGRKYLKHLWEAWYYCWKLENERKNPRKEVIKKLIIEITTPFGYNIFPFLAKALEDGDDSLNQLLRSIDIESGFSGRGLFYKPIRESLTVKDESYYLKSFDKITNADHFLKWWNANKDKYCVPYSEKQISDLKSILPEKSCDFLAELEYKKLLETEHALVKFCNQPLKDNTNCWYYRLED